MGEIIRARAYVVGDNVDTDQIIPAQYLTQPQPEIVVGGDHISYAYWFYQ